MRCWSGVRVCSLTVSAIHTSRHAVWSSTSRVSVHHGGSQDSEERTIMIGRPDRPETAATAASSNMQNCDEGGCDRCSNREHYTSGSGYDVCICVHAEQNALLSAARFGISVR